MVDNSRLRPERTSRASLGTGPSTEHRSVPDGVQLQCAARLAACCSLQRASDDDSDAAIEEKAAISVHGRDPQGWASATRPIMGALPLSAVSQHESRAAWRGCKVPPDTLPSAQRELELRTGFARFPNVTLSLFDPPHLRQDQDHSPSRHGPHPARHG